MSYRYDEPLSTDDIRLDEESPADRAKEAAGTAIDILKEHKKKVLAAIVIVVLGYFIYDFFIGSYRDVSIRVVNTEGNEISAAVKVLGPEGKEVDKFSGSKTIRLKKGNYEIQVSKPGYRPKTQAHTVGDGANDAEIEIEKAIDAGIQGEFPSTALTGEMIETPVVLTNNGDDAADIELVMDGSGGDISFDYSPQQVTIGAGQTLPVTATVKVSETAKPREIKGKIRIKYTNEGISANFSIKKFLASEVVFEPKKYAETLKSGEIKKNDFKIRNGNDFPLKSLQLYIEITTAQYCDKSKAINWFTLDPPGAIDEVPAAEGSSKKGELPIQVSVLIDPKDVDIPADAQNATLGGYLVLKSSYMEKKLKFDFIINKTKAGLQITGITDRYEAPYNSVAMAYTKSDEIQLSNPTGSVALTEVNIMDFKCKTRITDDFSRSEYAKVTTSKWGQIAPGEKKSTTLLISVSSIEPENKTFYCKMTVTYNNPFFVPGGDEPILAQEKEFQIVTKPA